MSAPRRLPVAPARPATEATDFDELIELTSPRLYRLAARLTGSLEDAEDVLQDSYLQAVRAVRSGSFLGRATLETWLYRVVTNGALRARTKRGRASALAEPSPAPFQDRAHAELRAELAILAGWLNELPEDQRAALVLKELEGLSTAEAAAVLECSEGAVEQRLVRARAALRARYRDE